MSFFQLIIPNAKINLKGLFTFLILHDLIPLTTEQVCLFLIFMSLNLYSSKFLPVELVSLDPATLPQPERVSFGNYRSIAHDNNQR